MGRMFPAPEIGFIAWQNQIEVMSIDLRTTLVRNLTRHPAAEEEFMWSPDGSKLVFVSNRDFNRDLFVMDSDGRNLRQLTHTETDNRHPAWSPDGKTIAYVHDVSYEDANQDIHTVDVESGSIQPLVTETTDDDFPAWSPDGRHLAYISENRIYVIDNQSGARRLLVEQAGGIGALVWSPDSRRIAFSTPLGVLVTSLDSAETQVVVKQAAAPGWSPDGERLMIAANREGSLDTMLCTVKVDGTSLGCFDHGVIRDYYGTWSADGHLIAFISSLQRQLPMARGGTVTLSVLHIFVMNADGSGLRQLTTGDNGSSAPSWRPVKTHKK